MSDSGITIDFSMFRPVGGGGAHNNYFEVPEEAADNLFMLTKLFWTNRFGQTEEELEGHTATYRETASHSTQGAVEGRLYEIAERAIEAEGSVSLIDLGGASGFTFYALKEKFPDTDIAYCLIEPFQRFADDFRERNPGQEVIETDAEGFIDLADDAFERSRYSLFFSSHVLYLMKPRVVRSVLARAAKLTDEFLIADNLMNFSGRLSADKPVVFDYLPEGMQYYFSHYYEDYLAAAGFEAIDVHPTPATPGGFKEGFGFFQARRG